MSVQRYHVAAPGFGTGVLTVGVETPSLTPRLPGSPGTAALRANGADLQHSVGAGATHRPGPQAAAASAAAARHGKGYAMWRWYDGNPWTNRPTRGTGGPARCLCYGHRLKPASAADRVAGAERPHHRGAAGGRPLRGRRPAGSGRAGVGVRATGRVAHAGPVP